MTIQIKPIDESTVSDEALEALLHESYVGGGFTAPDVADKMLRAQAVRSRGTVLVAYDDAGAVVGTVTVVGPESQARRLGTTDEREIHLLCVRPDARGAGVGRALMLEALTLARADGARRVVLWTQPAMDAAQRLYEQLGFRRDPDADFEHGPRRFLVYRLVFDAGGDMSADGA